MLNPASPLPLKDPELFRQANHVDGAWIQAESGKTITVGDPFDPNTRSGPVVSRAAFERILGSIDKAKTEGAGKLICGGAPMGGALFPKAWPN